MRSRPCFQLRRLLGAALMLTAVTALSTAARADSSAADAQACGNGYCDAWANETAESCPVDCSRPNAPHEWRPGDTATPPGFHVEKRPLRSVIITGGILGGAGTLASILFAVPKFGNGGAFSIVPIVGPFVAANAYKPPKCGDLGGCAGSSVADLSYKIEQYTFGIVEVTGAALLIGGAIARRDTLVPDRGPVSKILPVPMVGPKRAGVGFIGMF